MPYGGRGPGPIPMVDSRGVLSQDIGGGHLGLPCVRPRPRTKRDLLPEVVRPPPEREGDPLPGSRFENRPEYISFSGTQNLPWAMARSRSMGALSSGGVVDKALRHRQRTDLDLLVEVLADSVRDDRPQDIRHFRQPFNAHRHTEASTDLSPDVKRKKVLQVLMKYPLTDIYDMATCSPEHWSDISRELGGLSHGVAMRTALDYVQQTFSPIERAAFWAACGPRQRVVDHSRQTHFAANSVRGLGRRMEGFSTTF
mmetsp:Transcript_124923/g.314366  ORF Transcript_124923/g.314366 Transcript_124923/m.314366 type:complete len:255 (+) Transcript_124923:156-920(+)